MARPSKKQKEFDANSVKNWIWVANDLGSDHAQVASHDVEKVKAWLHDRITKLSPDIVGQLIWWQDVDGNWCIGTENDEPFGKICEGTVDKVQLV